MWKGLEKNDFSDVSAWSADILLKTLFSPTSSEPKKKGGVAEHPLQMKANYNLQISAFYSQVLSMFIQKQGSQSTM